MLKRRDLKPKPSVGAGQGVESEARLFMAGGTALRALREGSAVDLSLSRVHRRVPGEVVT